MIEALLTCGVNRVSLGVQSFVDVEAAAVGRLHKRSTVLDDIARLRAARIHNINIDLIAGLPHQTAATWQESLEETLASGVPHVSVYMLEVDEDSRLGREVIAGGTRYHAHVVPDEEATADFYLAACKRLEAADIAQYEISNFARAGSQSRHNLKYWTRQPYLGFGVDAHSMLVSALPDAEAIRFAAANVLEKYVAGSLSDSAMVSRTAALEENFFLGLRLNRGVSLRQIAASFGQQVVENLRPAIAQLIADKVLEETGDRIRLTARGRLLSNEVFQAFLAPVDLLPKPQVSPAVDISKASGRLGEASPLAETPVMTR
jgi:oxygen-independent coproporphyrinogen III oxidase